MKYSKAQRRAAARLLADFALRAAVNEPETLAVLQSIVMICRADRELIAHAKERIAVIRQSERLQIKFRELLDGEKGGQAS